MPNTERQTPNAEYNIHKALREAQNVALKPGGHWAERKGASEAKGAVARSSPARCLDSLAENNKLLGVFWRWYFGWVTLGGVWRILATA